jgi:hypothetical protein
LGSMIPLPRVVFSACTSHLPSGLHPSDHTTNLRFLAEKFTLCYCFAVEICYNPHK